MGKIIRKKVDLADEPTPAQLEEIKMAAQYPISTDEDSPEYTYDEIMELIETAKEKRSVEKKEIVTLRVSPETLKKAKKIGKGYTSFLSRLLDNAMNDKKLVARSL